MTQPHDRHICYYLLLILFTLGWYTASAQVVDTNLNEKIIAIPKIRDLLPTINLEATLFTPPGSGPFPLIVMNHGKQAGNPRAQPRIRYANQAKEFLKRNYAVIIPMRQGFAQSEGHYDSVGCDFEKTSQLQAQDIVATIDFMRTQDFIDTKNIIVIGQSQGGLISLALATQTVPGLKGIINFSGGFRNPSCPNWQNQLLAAFASYGLTIKYPSLWFYGDNDALWSPQLITQMVEQFTKTGGSATIVRFGSFRQNAHTLFGDRQGNAIWLPAVGHFFEQLGLPFEERYAIPNAQPQTPIPSPTQFAPLTAIQAVPKLNNKGRAAYSVFLEQDIPRAFALSPTGGAYAWSSGDDLSVDFAVQNCRKYKADCRLYAVDHAVVW